MIRNRSVILFVLLSIAASAVLGQTAEGFSRTIPIAIPDAVPFGVNNADRETSRLVDLYTSSIITEVSSVPFFQVLERKQANEIYSEISYQLQTGGELSEAVLNTKLRGAGALLLTGFGELYGKIVITARLVDLQTGRILLATTTYSKPEEVLSAVKELAASIREKGSELGKSVSLEDVRRAVKTRSWQEAKRLADAYLRDHPGDEAVRELYGVIAKNRAEQLFRDAKKSVGLRLFKEARIAIDEAIALVPEGRYYAYRDEIFETEVKDQYRVKAEAARRDEQLRTGTYAIGFWERLGDHFQKVTAEEFRIGASYSPVLFTPDLALDFTDGDWGLEFGWTGSKRPADGKALLNWVWYAGLAARYERVSEGGMGTFVGAWVSPLAAQAIQLGPFVAMFGLDFGGFFQYGPFTGEPTRLGIQVGGSAELAIRFGTRWGIFTSAKADWRAYPGDPGRDGPAFRLCAGLTL